MGIHYKILSAFYVWKFPQGNVGQIKNSGNITVMEMNSFIVLTLITSISWTQNLKKSLYESKKRQ